MKLLALNQLIGKLKRGSDIVDSHVVLPMHVSEAHARSQPANNARNRHSRAFYHRLAMLGFLIDYDSFVDGSPHRSHSNSVQRGQEIVVRNKRPLWNIHNLKAIHSVLVRLPIIPHSPKYFLNAK